MLDGAQRIIAELKSEHHDKHGSKATAHEVLLKYSNKTIKIGRASNIERRLK